MKDSNGGTSSGSTGFSAWAVAIAALLFIASNAYCDDDEDQPGTILRTMTQEMLDASTTSDSGPFEHYMDSRIIHVDDAGAIAGKEEWIQQLVPLPTGVTAQIEIVAFAMQLHGDIAVTTHEDQAHTDYFGHPMISRYRSTDTWLHTEDGWRLIAQHTQALQKDPPVMSTGWTQGCDYSGRYRLTAQVETIVSCEGRALNSRREDHPSVNWKPEAPDVFFVPGQSRTRRIFERDAKGHVTAFVDRRDGHDIRWQRVAD